MMTAWKQARVGDILKIRNGYAVKSRDYSKEGVPLIRQSDINGDTIDIAEAKRVPTRVMEECGEYLVRKGDLLIGMSGSLGKIGRYVNDEVAIQNQRTGLLELKPGFSAGFAKLVLKFVEPQIIAEGKGVAVQNVSAKEIEDCIFPLPPEKERERIVAEIEKQFTRLDAGASSVKRVQTSLKRYRGSVLKAACAGRLVPTEAELARKENRSYETGEELLPRILKKRREKWNHKGKYKEPVSSKNADLPTLPEGWTWATVGQLTDESMIGLDRGRSQQTHRPDTGVPYIKMNNVTMEGRVIFEKISYVPATSDEKARFRVREDDVLFNTRNSKELVGKVGIVRNPPANAIYNNNLMRLRFADGVIPAVVNLQMISHDFRRRMELVKKATTNVAAVYGKDLFPLPIALPPVGEQQRIVAEAERRVSVLDELDNVVGLNLAKAQALRRAFLQVAFEGRLSNYGH
jgi:type I restriction enzyme, S subunit